MMRQKSNSTPVTSENLVRDIRRATRKHHDLERSGHGWTFCRLEAVVNDPNPSPVKRVPPKSPHSFKKPRREAGGHENSSSLTDDAHFVTVNGAWTKTRATYLDLMQRLHDANGPFRSSTRETPEMHVRFLAPDVAMMHSKFYIHGDVEEPERTGIGTRVVRKIMGGGGR